MKVKYGYTCSSYPQTIGEAESGCKMYQMNDIYLNTPPVSLDFSASFTNSNMAALCENNNYEIKIKSCKGGALKNVSLEITLPEGLTYLGNDKAISDNNPNPSIISLQNLETFQEGDFNNGDEIIINLSLNVGCSYVNNASINTVLHASSYCGTSVLKSLSRPLSITNYAQYFDPVSISDISCSSEQIIVNYNATSITTKTNSLTINLPAGFTFVNGGGSSKIILIPTGTIGAMVVTEPISSNITSGNQTVSVTLNQSATVTCGSTTCNRVNSLTSTCSFNIECPSVDAGEDQSVCAYTNVHLSGNTVAGATYSWTTPLGVEIGNTPSITVSPGQTTIYIYTITLGGCTRSDNVVVTVKPIPSVSIATSDGLMSALIPGCRSSLTLVATSGHASYQWSRNGMNIVGATLSTLVVSEAGTYSVKVTGSNGCTNSTSIPVINSITIAGRNEICLGQDPHLTVEIGGARGQYFVQWFKDNSTTPTTSPEGTAGSYYAKVVVVAPSCTLTTDNFTVTELPVPSPYVISATGNLYRCPSDLSPLILTGTAPASSNPTITSWSWNTGQTSSPITVDGAARSYFITGVGSNGCTSTSNVVSVVTPTISVGQECLPDGSTSLTASMNVIGTGYTWTNSQGTILGSSSNLLVNEDGHYTVSSSAFNCPVSNISVVCRSVSQTGINSNMIADGDFDKSRYPESTDCNPFDFLSDLNCTSTALTSSTWPGNFKISRNAGVENGSGWSGTGFYKPGSNDNYFLFADGPVTSEAKRVWHKTVSVENCAMYNFSALVKNIINNEAEVPRMFLQVNGHRIRQSRVFANQPDWVELGGKWKSNTTGLVEIGIWIEGGGWVGRDIGIDEVDFRKVDCSAPLTGSRICNAVAAVGSEKFICPGGSIEIGEIVTSSGTLNYTWKDKIGNVILTTTNSGAANPIVSPVVTTRYTLTVTDVVNNCSASDEVTVNVIDPKISITMVNDNCKVTFNASKFTGVGNVSYKWFVNNVLVTTNTTGEYSPANAKPGDIVKCQLIGACSSQPFSNQLTVPSSIFSVSAGEDVQICEGATEGVQLEASTALSYSWFPLIGLSDASIANPIATPTQTTTYTVTAVNASGCELSDEVTVTVNPKPTPPNLTFSSDALCEGETLSVNVNHYGLPVTIVSRPSFDVFFGTGFQGGFVEVGTVSESGDFIYRTTSAEGCHADAVKHLTVNPKPAPPNLTFSSDVLCEGETLSVNVNHYGFPVTIVSRPPFNVFYGTGFQGGFAEVGTVSESGDFIYRTTSAEGCNADAVKHLTVHLKPDPATIAVSPSGDICSGAPFTVTVNYGATNTLVSETYPPFNNRIGGGGSGGFSFTGIMGNQSGDIVIVSKTTEGCSTTTSRALNVKQSPAVPIITANLQTVCANNSNVITVDGLTSGGSFALQTPSGASILTTSNPTSSSKQFSIQYGTTGGNVKAIVTGSNGCEVSSSVYINVPVLPIVNYTLNKEQCYGSPVLLDATGSANESATFVEIFRTSCSTCSDVVGSTYYSNWLPAGVGQIDLATLYSSIGFQSGKFYRVKLALSSYGCNWVEKVTVITIRPAAVPSFTLPTTVCSNQPVSFDGSATEGELNHFIEIYKTSCSGCTDVTGSYFSNWFTGQAGTLDLRSIFSFSSTSGTWYKVKLAVNNQGCPWNETTRWVQIQGACREEEFDMDLSGDMYNVYPSPTDGNFWVAKSNLDPAIIQVTDINGRLLKEVGTSEMKTNVDVHHLASGIYVITIIQNDVVVKKKLELRK
ncbi:MAG: T9SS type A sorting domain-containing protein [Sporocytophaga sp.]|nr:T9SS type A sorting domain-containing protein [Sporocytophaga sp.]